MKKTIVFRLISFLFFTVALIVIPTQTSAKSLNSIVVAVTPGSFADTTVTVTIVKIDLRTNSISLKDGNGKIWNFVVNPQLINLRNFKVGQSVTATISTTIVTDKVTRARITKTDLLKLQ